MKLFGKSEGLSEHEMQSLRILANYDATIRFNQLLGMGPEPDSIAVLRADLKARGILPCSPKESL